MARPGHGRPPRPAPPRRVGGAAIFYIDDQGPAGFSIAVPACFNSRYHRRVMAASTFESSMSTSLAPRCSSSMENGTENSRVSGPCSSADDADLEAELGPPLEHLACPQSPRRGETRLPRES